MSTADSIVRAVSAAPAPVNQTQIARLVNWPGERRPLKEILDGLVEDGRLERLPSMPRYQNRKQRGWTGYRYAVRNSS